MGIEHRFGIEIETVFNRELGARTLGALWHTESTVWHKGGTYDKWCVKDSIGREWTCMSDSSVHALSSETRRIRTTVQSCEVVSPVLNWCDIEYVQTAVRALKQAGAYANCTCGIHVHVSTDLTPDTMRSLVNLTNAQEDMLTLSLGITYERRNTWCHEVNSNFLAVLNRVKPNNLRDFENLWYLHNGGQDRTVHYDHSRYHLLNLHSYWQGKGVEFRAFNGTMHAGKIKAYIQLSCAMVGKAEASKSSSPKRPVTDNPAYTFRCWLLRLGLIGDEYKTARQHLLANMPGNAAWRHVDATTRHAPQNAENDAD